MHEWYDDTEQRYRIDVRVTNRRWGRLFGYRGWFNAREVACDQDSVPLAVLPARVERRE